MRSHIRTARSGDVCDGVVFIHRLAHMFISNSIAGVRAREGVSICECVNATALLMICRRRRRTENQLHASKVYFKIMCALAGGSHKHHLIALGADWGHQFVAVVGKSYFVFQSFSIRVCVCLCVFTLY